MKKSTAIKVILALGIGFPVAAAIYDYCTKGYVDPTVFLYTLLSLIITLVLMIWK